MQEMERPDGLKLISHPYSIRNPCRGCLHSELWKRSRLPKSTSPGNPMVTSYLTPEMRMCLTSFCCSWDAWLEIVKRRRLRCTIWHSVLLVSRTLWQFVSIWSGQVWRHFRTFKKGKAACQRNLPYLCKRSAFDHWPSLVRLSASWAEVAWPLHFSGSFLRPRKGKQTKKSRKRR